MVLFGFFLLSAFGFFCNRICHEFLHSCLLVYIVCFIFVSVFVRLVPPVEMLFFLFPLVPGTACDYRKISTTLSI